MRSVQAFISPAWAKLMSWSLILCPLTPALGTFATWGAQWMESVPRFISSSFLCAQHQPLLTYAVKT